MLAKAGEKLPHTQTNLKVSSIQLVNLVSTGSPGDSEYLGSIEIKFDSSSTEFSLRPLRIQKVISLNSTDPASARKIVSCRNEDPPINVAANCASFGGTYVSSPAPARCQMPFRIPTTQTECATSGMVWSGGTCTLGGGAPAPGAPSMCSAAAITVPIASCANHQIPMGCGAYGSAYGFSTASTSIPQPGLEGSSITVAKDMFPGAGHAFLNPGTVTARCSGGQWTLESCYCDKPMPPAPSDPYGSYF